MSKIRSILIVDDNEDDIYIAQRAIKKGKFSENILSANDGEKALELFQNFDKSREIHGENFPPAVVFLDINMPRMDGFEFLEAYDKLEKKDGYGSMFFIMISSSGREEDCERAKRYEFVKDHIIKPPTQEKLAEVFSNLGLLLD